MRYTVPLSISAAANPSGLPPPLRVTPLINAGGKKAAFRRKNPTTSPGIMLSEMPIAAEIILPLGRVACIMKMTDYTVYYRFGGKLPWQLNMN